MSDENREKEAEVATGGGEGAVYSNSLEKTAWRIDVKTKAKNTAEMSEPIAIVELLIAQVPC